MNKATRVLTVGCVSTLLYIANAHASELSYTFLDFQYIQQEVAASGSQFTAGGIQTVNVDLEDGDGIAVSVGWTPVAERRP